MTGRAIALLAAALLDGLPLAALAPQPMPAAGCTMFLFATGERRALVATVSDSPASLRLAPDGDVRDLPGVAARGASVMGFPAQADYRAGDVAVTLTVSIEQRADLRDGAAVPEALLRIDRPGRDGLAVPLVGLIGCAPVKR